MPSKRVNPEERRRCIRACERCQRRKQRCDGEQPCRRCRLRLLGHECKFADNYRNHDSQSVSSQQHLEQQEEAVRNVLIAEASTAAAGSARSDTYERRPSRSSSSSKSTPPSHNDYVPRSPRVVRDAHEFMVDGGELSNISFIKHIRGLVRSSNGSCAFADEDGSPMLLDDYQVNAGDWMHSPAFPGKPSLADAILLVRRYTWATNCVADLFNEHDLLQHLLAFFENDEGDLLTRATFYLVWAIGLQVSPDGDDRLANRYFQHGRYLAAAHLGESPTVPSTQCDVLITWFLLSAGRRNSAYVQLGTAIRAAYALDLHDTDTDVPFDGHKRDDRERLWKTICILDGFMTAALGKPSSITYDSHEPKINGKYSSTYDLCLIFVNIHKQVYAGRKISNDVVLDIAAQHRRWSSLFQQGIEADGISSAGFLEGRGTPWPNIGLYHLKEAYYWSIMLLTLPFLTDFVSKCVLERCASLDGMHKQDSQSSSLGLPVHTCVSAAIGTLEMLEKLFSGRVLPRRLPFVVNSAFISAIIIGISFFGDLDNHFPLQRHLRTAQSLLSLLRANDPIAREASMTVAYLQNACDAYLDKRRRHHTERRASLFAGLFGDLGGGKASRQAGAQEALVPTQRTMDVIHSARAQEHAEDIDDSCDTGTTATTDESLLSMPAPGTTAHKPSEPHKKPDLDMSGVGLQGSHGILPVDSSGSLYLGSLESEMVLFPFKDADYMTYTNFDSKLDNIFLGI